VRRYLKPTGPTAADALLPSDPGLALALAQELVEAPRMSNHNHGLWGYHGETRHGRELTIQSTGIGGPSAAGVLQELTHLGVRRAVRVGAGAAPAGTVVECEAVVVDGALARDGTSAALGATGLVPADRSITDRLAQAAGQAARRGTVASVDLLEDRVPAGSDVLCVDLETAALLALGQRLELTIGAIVGVGDAAGVELGKIALEALLQEAPARWPGPGVAAGF
jgi:uridine phosphorylase